MLPRSSFRSLVLAAAWTLSAGAAFAQPSPSLAELGIERLKSLVLHCDRESSRLGRDVGTAAICAQAAEDLRRRAFDGSPERLLAWLRQQRAAERGGREAAPAHAPPAKPQASAGEPELKAAYLQCDRLALAQMLDFATAASCSATYEALKARVFGGDFERLLAWWRQQQDGPVAATQADSRPAP